MEVIAIISILKDYFTFMKQFSKNIMKFIKYQIITKGILSIIIIPGYGFLSGYLVKNNGKMMFTNGDILKFMLTPSGAIFMLFLFIIIVVEIVIEIGGYITISCKIEGGYGESSYLEILKYNINLLPRMLSVGGIIILLYIGFMAPMTGIGFRLSFLKGFSTPNFVKSVIDQSFMYSTIYTIGIMLLIYVSIKFIFTFNYMIIYKMKAYESIKASCVLFKKNKKRMIKELASVFIITTIVAFIVIFLWMTLIVKLSENLDLNKYIERVAMLSLLQIQGLVIIVISMLVVPFECYYVTRLFYKIIDKEEIKYPIIAEKKKQSIMDIVFKKKRTLILVTVASIFLYSITLGLFTTEILGYNNKIDVYGHRGYGEGMPENSLSAIKKSIQDKLDYVEIDVQRTKDRKYVLNHDKTFERVSYNSPPYINKRVNQLTLSQIEKLDIGSKVSKKYSGERVPTLEQVLDLCKNKIKINLELKENVDKKMIDDVMDMIEKKGMKKQVFLTSLNAENINYIEKKNPTFDTGIIYFIKLGDYQKFNSDYMIMEEREANEKTINKIHSHGKRVIVWTINTPESIDKFSKMDVDGIITDYPDEVKKIVNENSKLSINDLILTSFIKELDDILLNII